MARHLPLRNMPARRFLFAPVAWLVAAVMAMAAADPLTVIPDDALGLAVIKNLSDASSRVQKLTQKMQLTVPALLPMAQLYTGAQRGLDDKGSLAAAMFPSDEENAPWSSTIAVFVPVTDYKVFVAQLLPDDATAEISEVTISGRQFLVTNKGEFAVLATSDAKPLLKHIRGASNSVATMLKPLQPWLAKQQIAVVLTPAGKKHAVKAVNRFIGIAAKAAGQVADGADDDTPGGVQAVQSAGEAMEAFKDLLAAVDAQVTHLGIGASIDDATVLRASARLIFEPDGGLSQWARTARPPIDGLLAGLPPDKFALAYGGAAVQFHPAVNKIVDRMTQVGLMTVGLDDQDRKKLSEIMIRYRDGQTSTAGLLGQLRPGDSIIATSMQIEHVKDAEQHLKVMREMFAVMAKAQFPGADPAKPLYELRDVTVGDIKALEVTTDLTALVRAGGGGQQGVAEAMRGFFSKLIGSAGVMRAYSAVADDHTVVTAYSKGQLQRGVKHIRSGVPGLEADDEIAKTDKLLPQGAQWAAYISPQGVIQWIDMVVKQLPAESKYNVPPFPPSDPIGVAAKVSADGMDAELVLPESVVEGIGQYVGLIQRLLQGGTPLP